MSKHLWAIWDLNRFDASASLVLLVLLVPELSRAWGVYGVAVAVFGEHCPWPSQPCSEPRGPRGRSLAVAAVPAVEASAVQRIERIEAPGALAAPCGERRRGRRGRHRNRRRFSRFSRLRVSPAEERKSRNVCDEGWRRIRQEPIWSPLGHQYWLPQAKTWAQLQWLSCWPVMSLRCNSVKSWRRHNESEVVSKTLQVGSHCEIRSLVFVGPVWSNLKMRLMHPFEASKISLSRRIRQKLPRPMQICCISARCLGKARQVYRSCAAFNRAAAGPFLAVAWRDGMPSQAQRPSTPAMPVEDVEDVEALRSSGDDCKWLKHCVLHNMSLTWEYLILTNLTTPRFSGCRNCNY